MIADAEADDAPDEDEEDDGLATRMPLSSSDAEQAYRSRYGYAYHQEVEEPSRVRVSFHVETTRETVVVPYYVPADQPKPRTIEDFQRDRDRGRAEDAPRDTWISLSAISTNGTPARRSRR